ncbi:hypothetical protein EVAR_17911_1 [Eumeta japonica]|uniref:Uncharacterized protein n=1 Tax=Eumeta variegata TaxID=151549 RepID=A0A4C1UZP2_EUMVA|nr:hypothetical protein EVAR_17911_1 [Eumeta japonica]
MRRTEPTEFLGGAFGVPIEGEAVDSDQGPPAFGSHVLDCGVRRGLGTVTLGAGPVRVGGHSRPPRRRRCGNEFRGQRLNVPSEARSDWFNSTRVKLIGDLGRDRARTRYHPVPRRYY